MRSRVALALLMAGALSSVTASGVGLLAAMRHDEARAAWARESRALDGGGYSAERSDALYEDVLVHGAQAERAAWAAALGALVLAVGWGSRSGGVASEGWTRAPAARSSLSTLLDGAALIGGISLALWARPRLGATHAGFGALAEVLGLAGVTCALLAGLARGATPGALLLALRFRGLADRRSPGLLRGLLALALLPLSLGLLAITWPLGRLPLHLRWAGLEAVRPVQPPRP